MGGSALRASTFSILAGQAARHAVFARSGGVSPHPCDSLNLSFGVGDSEANVRENRRRLKEAMGIGVLASARQVHGDAVWVIDAPLAEDTEREGCDALITDQAGIGLMVQQADCQAVLLLDPVRGVAANVHAGWRGSVAGIIGSTVAVMTERFRCRPADILAAISPSLGPCCAEFVNFQSELPPGFHAHRVDAQHFDFWAISREQLLNAGLRRERIEIAGICTRCDEKYFSYRRERVTGRFASVIALLRS